jgi:hypothetical protein
MGNTDFHPEINFCNSTAAQICEAKEKTKLEETIHSRLL